jgi:thymidylate synthase (FAD)
MTALEDLRWRKLPVLDQGFVCLVDAMGDDAAIARAARVSYGAGTRSVSDDRTLLRYLMRHHHATPFEMCEVCLYVRVPMDHWRQWIRHRTANVNEYSTRYSEAIDAAQATAPDAWRRQARGNKQGSGGTVSEWPEGYEVSHGVEWDEHDGKFYPGDDSVLHYLAGGWSLLEAGRNSTPGEWLTNQERELQEHARRVYEERLRFGVAREQARKDLPLSTYTEAYWKCDLRNVLHFLALRMDSHAQQEIRAYATVIGEQIVAPLFPLAWEAFRDYVLESITLSSLDRAVISAIAAGADANEAATRLVLNKREREECLEKLARLRLTPPRTPCST